MNRFSRVLIKTSRLGGSGNGQLLNLTRLTPTTSSILPQVLTTAEFHDNAGFKTGSRFNYTSLLTATALAGLAGYGFYSLNYKSRAYCEQKENETPEPGQVVSSLPFYTEEEVAKHNKDAETIWISFKSGVYDITEFVASHPGGDKILMAAGSSAEPFWSIYTIHQNPDVYAILESYRIGNLKQDANKSTSSSSSSVSDPFRNDPKRHPLLKILTQKPFNAETPKAFSVESYLTPNELHFVRNHLPVPTIDPETFRLEIVNEITGEKKELRLDELRRGKYRVHKFPVTLQCSGNKRKLMHDPQRPVQGLMWDVNAISTAEWTGIQLRDLLADLGVDFNDPRIKHIHFEGLDKDPSGAPYGASIPKDKVFSEKGDVLIAFQMNDQDIPADFGFPLRAITPGIIGARSVKWLNRIVISERENESHWQKNDYKLLPPSLRDLKEADFSKLKAAQESPIQSAICEPVDGAVVTRESGSFIVKGYAYSGGGNSIEQVLVSMDNGENWKTARLQQRPAPLYQQWAWTIWEAEFEIPKDKQGVELVCVATDSSNNTQPETCKSIWNARGLFNNSWHKIKVHFK